MLGKIIKFMVFGLVLSLAGGYFAWLHYEPVLTKKWEEIKEKDPDKHAVMAEELGAFHFEKAKALYEEIDAMSYEEVLDLRYRKLNKKRQADKKFRIEEWEKELVLRAKTKEARAEIHQNKADVLENLRTEREFKTAQVFWERASPMEKGVLLRFNCAKYLEKERSNSQLRSHSPDLPSVSVQLAPPRGPNLLPSDYCAQLIPDTLAKEDVLRIIDILKKEMNYFYFIEMMEEIGIAKSDVYSFDLQLDRMSSDFSDS
ncbi:MAG: hypothetical protein COV66_06090 [Nitrospinae bacterium CG11_big_fil_rev_8_21_14_0_20_45_15]|nr:MAG: hypothetical protein COV66_06090 [Nitrospinae bacterium CG11_big_fil_rev_8_21_14_0_20_45_15]